ncbi:hypothetical protein C8F04DRAFT_413787 [Mycena alexandri]|uniref:Uncharacterized protein n=1 Tax=Mycena alexandri TaxID=1745969 RepID=A0AAD6T335_9AGAR|nr:hypothetical protein C8F04DRAFT_413787 [Mycena alexandri]
MGQADARPAESTSPAPGRCTLSENDLNVKEYIEFQTLSSQGALAFAGGLPSDTTNAISNPQSTNAWEASAIFTPIIVAMAYEKILGGNVPPDLCKNVIAAIGDPAQLTRGHLFAILRLLKHYHSTNSMSVVCTEYIHKNWTPGEASFWELPTSRSDPTVPDAESRPDQHPSKRRRSEVGPATAHNLLPTDAQLKGLEWASHLVPLEVKHYAEPEYWHKLPFPFCYPVLPHDRFDFENARSDTNDPYLHFDWMGREVFPLLVDAVASLTTDGTGSSAAFLEGPIGVGKSHLLAALALLLRRQGKVVVYIPHCGDLLQSPVHYMAAALLCAFPGTGPEDKARRSELRYLKSTAEIVDWCRTQSAQRGVQFHFLVDQLNGLEAANSGMTPVRQCEAVKSFLLQLYVDNICVRSSSANDQHGLGIHGRGQREEMLSFSQTLTEAECSSWLNRFSHRLPTFEPHELQWFHEFTGHVFLYYSALLQHPRIPFTEAWDQIQHGGVLENARQNVQEFGARIMTSGNTATITNYWEGVKACVTNASVQGIATHLIDRRYCVVAGGRGRVTCGLARRELIQLLEKHDSNVALSTEWLNDGFTNVINSPPAVGFLVERSVIRTLMSGVDMLQPFQWSQVRKHVLASGAALPRDLPSSLRERGQIKTLLIVPAVFNFKAIDCLYISVDNVQKRVRIIPVQITIADHHKPSAEDFYLGWKDWIHQFPGYEIETRFLWIVDGFKPGTEEYTPAPVRTTRQGVTTGVEIKQSYIHLEHIAPRVWESLVSARQRQELDEMTM